MARRTVHDFLEDLAYRLLDDLSRMLEDMGPTPTPDKSSGNERKKRPNPAYPYPHKLPKLTPEQRLVLRHLRTLGLEPDQFDAITNDIPACEAVVRGAWKPLVVEAHPDKNPKRLKWAHKRTARLNEAKAYLLGMLEQRRKGNRD